MLHWWLQILFLSLSTNDIIVISWSSELLINSFSQQEGFFFDDDIKWYANLINFHFTFRERKRFFLLYLYIYEYISTNPKHHKCEKFVSKKFNQVAYSTVWWNVLQCIMMSFVINVMLKWYDKIFIAYALLKK